LAVPLSFSLFFYSPFLFIFLFSSSRFFLLFVVFSAPCGAFHGGCCKGSGGVMMRWSRVRAEQGSSLARLLAATAWAWQQLAAAEAVENDGWALELWL
jgi:hypothetical protein